MFISLQGIDEQQIISLCRRGFEIYKRKLVISSFLSQTKTLLSSTKHDRTELISKSSYFRQEMSYKAREQSENPDVFPTSPTSDKSTSSLSPPSTLTRGKRKHRRASDKGYGSTNSSLSESGRPELYILCIYLDMQSAEATQSGVCFAAFKVIFKTPAGVPYLI